MLMLGTGVPLTWLGNSLFNDQFRSQIILIILLISTQNQWKTYISSQNVVLNTAQVSTMLLSTHKEFKSGFKLLKYEIFTVMTMKIAELWDVMTSGLLDI